MWSMAEGIRDTARREFLNEFIDKVSIFLDFVNGKPLTESNVRKGATIAGFRKDLIPQIVRKWTKVPNP